ncbi:hypothetical protein F53441_8181 [Fusarium austroafricanum]|uniref:C2H2-type domain-containing protein n=1 Tax=Fusarium austroafricanum TaxID=2364996 RepID=A0A8H4KEX7_9HYPO|nr:hypothetical protein F53441_8181 [Fusarium austroafricanum]
MQSKRLNLPEFPDPRENDVFLSPSSDGFQQDLSTDQEQTVNPQQLIVSGDVPQTNLSVEKDSHMSPFDANTFLPEPCSFPQITLPEVLALIDNIAPNQSIVRAQTYEQPPNGSQNAMPRSNSGQNPEVQSGGRRANAISSPWSISLFACPYYIKDPIRHFGCINLKLDSYGRVKQHLKRTHLSFDVSRLEGFACERCGMIVLDESREMHRISPDCTETTSVNEPQVSRQAWESLEKRFKSGSSDEEKWLNMWFVLFHQPLGTSIPIKDTVMNRFIQIIRNYCQVDGFGEILSFIEETRGVELESALQMHELLMKLLDFIRDSIQQHFNAKDAGTSG